MTAAMPTPRYSLVVPVYKNEASIDGLLSTVAEIDRALGGKLELVVVVDGSPDRSFEILQELLPDQLYPSRLIRHARNFGSFAAVRTGLQAAAGTYFAVMAADLQEPPELIIEFFSRLDKGNVSLLIGERRLRADPASTKWASSGFWASYRRFVQPAMPVGGIDVFAGSDAVRSSLVELREANSSLVGQLIWLGFEYEAIPYDRRHRADNGPSGWTFRKKFRYMMDSVYGFSALPIHVVTLIGAVGTILCLLIGTLIIVGRLTDSISVRGYTALMVTTLGCTSLVLTAIGIVGNYVWRAFENSKQRPLAVVDRSERYP